MPENITAKELYKKLGFELTGEMDDDEEIMESKY
jgi:ribosomal protein S18 acetylase RimI-like enzyme